MTVTDGNYTEATVVARKARQCDDVAPRCHHIIRPGEAYLRAVAFPGHDANWDGLAPWVLHLCEACATRYGKTMPPRRRGKT